MTSMDIRDVTQELAEIERVLDDPEESHAKIDGLYIRVLNAIADGADLSLGHAISLAREALKAEDLDSTKWYA